MNLKPIKELLMIPGPTMVPMDILLAQAQQMINHRGPKFLDIQRKIMQDGKKLFKTELGEIYVLTSSGTGALEASVVNFSNVGDKVLVIEIGSFGERYTKICRAYQRDVDVMTVTLGEPADPKLVSEKIKSYPKGKLKAVFFQHNETSTGVLNPIAELSKAVRQNSDALVICDSVSGLMSADLQMDAWELDVVAAGSQKAFMTGPGIALVAVSPRAIEAMNGVKTQSFYFDLKAAKKFAEKGETPWTPSLPILYGMSAAYDMIFKEGVDQVLFRHEMLMRATRAGVQALGCSLLAKNEAMASRAVTAVLPPAGIDAEKIRKLADKSWGVVFAGGQETLFGKIFRITHLGFTDPKDTLAALACLELTLKQLGHSVSLGSGVAAAQTVFYNAAAKE